MKKTRTIVAVIVMLVAGIAGLLIGSAIMTVLFSLIAGIACVIYAIDNPER